MKLLNEYPGIKEYGHCSDGWAQATIESEEGRQALAAFERLRKDWGARSKNDPSYMEDLRTVRDYLVQFDGNLMFDMRAILNEGTMEVVLIRPVAFMKTVTFVKMQNA